MVKERKREVKNKIRNLKGTIGGSKPKAKRA